MYKLSKYPKIEIKKTSKNLSENLRIDLNFYERQKDCTKSNKKTTATTKKQYKAQQKLHLLYFEFCIN